MNPYKKFVSIFNFRYVLDMFSNDSGGMDAPDGKFIIPIHEENILIIIFHIKKRKWDIHPNKYTIILCF
jgi:hypothetical protein